MGQLDGKVAIVTGAGRGIGKGIAKVFAREGAKVVVASRTPATVASVVAEIEAEGFIAFGVVVDVSNKEQIFNMVAETVKKFGSVDILVNNAQGFGTAEKPRASTIPTPMEDTDDAEWEYTFRTGATATLWGMQAVFPHMKKAGYGRIVNFASGSGMEGFPGNTPYNATKEAIRALTRTAAREWGKFGITVNTVAPGPIQDTEMFAAVIPEGSEKIPSMAASIPVKRLGRSSDVANAVCFLAAGESGFITGQTLMVCGGASLGSLSL